MEILISVALLASVEALSCAIKQYAYELPATAFQSASCRQAAWEPNLFKQERKRALSPSY